MKWAGRLVLLVSAVALLAGTRVFGSWPQVYVATDASMEPTVRSGEYFLATGPVRSLRRGMLVLFRYDDDGVFHVLRRVAGLPGDTVSLEGGRAVVNGRVMPWPYRILVPKAWRSQYVRGGNLFTWGPALVPPDSVLLLADTRDMLGFPDSRFIGPVAASAIEAQARRILWPPGHGRFLTSLRNRAVGASGAPAPPGPRRHF